MNPNLVRLDKHLRTDQKIDKCGTAVRTHIDFTILDLLHVNAFDSEWQDDGAVFQVFKNEVLFACIFRLLLPDFLALNVFDQQMIA